MRYFSHNEYIADNENIESAGIKTVSEDEIRQNYYPKWLELMKAKYGEDAVEAKYTFEDCLDDYITIHWAWEVTDSV